MAEASQIMFKFTEIAELLVKHQDIHEGNWGLVVRFGIAAANATGPSGEFLPTALVPILEMGIQKYDEPNPLTIDASVVNPAKQESTTKTRSAKKTR